MEVEVQFDGEQRVIEVFEHLNFDDRQMRQFANLVGAEMVNSTQERFDTETDPTGNPWLPSMRATAENGQTLRDTSRLMNSLTFVPLPDGVEWGTNVFYAPVQHYGATIRAKNAEFLKFRTAYGFVSKKEVEIPSRKFLGINESDVREINNITTHMLSEAWNG